MTAKQARPLDALKTYRYLRLGMIGAVVLLGASIVMESTRAENAVTGADWCLQTSISGYYFTPVRAIFVGCMFMIGLSLIAYKGRDAWEDFLLNIAGTLAPVVAIVPTTVVGDCYSIRPLPRPLRGESLAPWVLRNVDNNIDALLFLGSVALVLAFVVWRLNLRSPERRGQVQPLTRELLIGTFVVLAIIATLKFLSRDFFLEHAHGTSAQLMFGFLWLAVVANVIAHWNRSRGWAKGYLGVAMLMIIGLGAAPIFRDHKILVLEAWEIIAFAVYWILQTVENWDEEVIVRSGSDPGVQVVPP